MLQQLPVSQKLTLDTCEFKNSRAFDGYEIVPQFYSFSLFYDQKRLCVYSYIL